MVDRTSSSKTESSDIFAGLVSPELGSSERLGRACFVEVMYVGTDTSERKRIMDVVFFPPRGLKNTEPELLLFLVLRTPASSLLRLPFQFDARSLSPGRSFPYLCNSNLSGAPQPRIIAFTIAFSIRCSIAFNRPIVPLPLEFDARSFLQIPCRFCGPIAFDVAL